MPRNYSLKTPKKLLLEIITKLEKDLSEIQKELVQAQKESAMLKNIAMKNPISQLPNFNYIQAAAKKFRLQIEREQKNKPDNVTLKYVCAMFIDIDGLKAINDNFGHSVGDLALKQLGKILLEKTRGGEDIVGHIHGDEFLILTMSENRCLIKNMIKRIKTAVSSIHIPDHEITFSASVGYKCLPLSRRLSLKKLIGLADLKMYKEKRGK